MNPICFHVAGLPVPQGSMRGFARGGRVHLTSDNEGLKPWRTLVAYTAGQHRPQALLDGPLRVVLHFAMPRPPSVKRAKRPLPTVKPDIDKLERAVFDALKNVIWVDDALVTSVIKTKRYADDGAPVGVGIEIHADWVG